MSIQIQLDLAAREPCGPKVRACASVLYKAKTRKDQRAGTLSGGEREMLAIGGALMANPCVLLLDEPSAGLAPVVSASLFDKIRQISHLGTGTIVVEQDADRSLEISDRGCVLAMGEKVFEDKANMILSNEKIRKAYMGG